MKTEIVGELTQEKETTIRELLIAYELKIRCLSDNDAELIVDSYLAINCIVKDSPITIEFKK